MHLENSCWYYSEVDRIDIFIQEALGSVTCSQSEYWQVFFSSLLLLGGVRRDVHLKDLWLHITNELQKMTFKNVFCKTKLFEMQVQKLSEIQALSFDKCICSEPAPPPQALMWVSPEATTAPRAFLSSLCSREEPDFQSIDEHWGVYCGCRCSMSCILNIKDY